MDTLSSALRSAWIVAGFVAWGLSYSLGPREVGPATAHQVECAAELGDVNRVHDSANFWRGLSLIAITIDFVFILLVFDICGCWPRFITVGVPPTGRQVIDSHPQPIPLPPRPPRVFRSSLAINAA